MTVRSRPAGPRSVPRSRRARLLHPPRAEHRRRDHNAAPKVKVPSPHAGWPAAAPCRGHGVAASRRPTRPCRYDASAVFRAFLLLAPAVEAGEQLVDASSFFAVVGALLASSRRAGTGRKRGPQFTGSARQHRPRVRLPPRRGEGGFQELCGASPADCPLPCGRPVPLPGLFPTRTRGATTGAASYRRRGARAWCRSPGWAGTTYPGEEGHQEEGVVGRRRRPPGRRVVGRCGGRSGRVVSTASPVPGAGAAVDCSKCLLDVIEALSLCGAGPGWSVAAARDARPRRRGAALRRAGGRTEAEALARLLRCRLVERYAGSAGPARAGGPAPTKGSTTTTSSR